jgi:hypothetical protein
LLGFVKDDAAWLAARITARAAATAPAAEPSLGKGA